MDIEEDIKILEKDLFYYNEIKENFDEGTVKFYEALKHILAEREADKKRIKELEEKNKTLKNFTESIFNGDVIKDFIPKQKVKDKIEELKELKERKYNLIYTQPLETIKRINAQIKVLEELLEDK